MKCELCCFFVHVHVHDLDHHRQSLSSFSITNYLVFFYWIYAWICVNALKYKMQLCKEEYVVDKTGEIKLKKQKRLHWKFIVKTL